MDDKEPDKKKAFTFRLNTKVVDKVKAIAVVEQRSLQVTVERAIKLYIKQDAAK